MEQETYVTTDMENEVAALRREVQVWLATSVKSQKEFFIYAKQAVWLSAMHGNFLPLQDIQAYLDSMAELTGGLVNYAKSFKRLVRQIAGGVTNVDGVDYVNTKQSLLEYKNGKYALTGQATWQDVLGCLTRIPKTTMRILAYMKMPTLPNKSVTRYIRIREEEFIDLLADLDTAIQEDNMYIVKKTREILAEYYKS